MGKCLFDFLVGMGQLTLLLLVTGLLMFGAYFLKEIFRKK